MAKEGPLGRAEERMGFDVRGTGAGADATKFVFYEELANERFAKTVIVTKSANLIHDESKRVICRLTVISVERLSVPEKVRRL